MLLNGAPSLTERRPNWDRYYSTLERLPKRLKETAQFVRDVVPILKKYRVRTILDLGSGTGRHSILLANNGFEVVGVDISKSALKIAKRWARKQKLENIEWMCGSFSHLPLIDCCLDAAVSVSVIHHGLKKDIAKGIQEVNRILNDDGWFIANLASVDDPRYGKGRRLEKDTYWVLEKYMNKKFGETHHFFSKQEALTSLGMFSKAEVTRMEDKPNYWKIVAVK